MYLSSRSKQFYVLWLKEKLKMIKVSNFLHGDSLHSHSTTEGLILPPDHEQKPLDSGPESLWAKNRFPVVGQNERTLSPVTLTS